MAQNPSYKKYRGHGFPVWDRGTVRQSREGLLIITCAFHPHGSTALVTAVQFPALRSGPLSPGHEDDWPAQIIGPSWESNVHRVQRAVTKPPVFVAEGVHHAQSAGFFSQLPSYAVCCCNLLTRFGSHNTHTRGDLELDYDWTPPLAAMAPTTAPTLLHPLMAY